MYNKVIVALDGSRLAEKALPHAEAIARGLSVKLVLLHVVPYPPVEDAGIESDLEKIDKKYLEGLAQDLRTGGLEADVEVLWGNVPNDGLIENLPGDCVVEVACRIDDSGMTPLHYGSLPPQLASLMTTNINVQRMMVEAAIHRSRQAVYQAALLDPHTAAELDPDQIRAMVDELIAAHGSLIPELA